jgi:hypothetical protein
MLSVSHELCIMRIKLDGVRVALSYVLYVVFCRSLFVLLSFFFFVNCGFSSSPIYGFIMFIKFVSNLRSVVFFGSHHQ